MKKHVKRMIKGLLNSTSKLCEKRNYKFDFIGVFCPIYVMRIFLWRTKHFNSPSIGYWDSWFGDAESS